MPPSSRRHVLCVLTSTNQLYSGIGRALFAQAERLADRVHYEFAIDDYDARNVQLLLEFGRSHGFPVHVGPSEQRPDSIDCVSRSWAGLLRLRCWDAVECFVWADAAAHAEVLRLLGDRPLFYTPHHQPTWTVPMGDAVAKQIEVVHRRMLERADVVFCDSPWECAALESLTAGRARCAYVPLGCEMASFQPGALVRKEQLLFVGDLAEPRKRFDRVVALLAALHERRPGLRLLVVGNRSDEQRERIPEHLRGCCELRGYVSEPELRAAYAESQALVLLSDFEAFGIPILEALACGTPVFLSEQEATRSLFGSFAGAHFCPAGDLTATLAIVEHTLDRGTSAIEKALADRARLAATFDWDVVAEAKWRAMEDAWAKHAAPTHDVLQKQRGPATSTGPRAESA